MKRKATFAAAFGVIAALSITPAYADDPAVGAADAADVAAQAKQLFREGLDAAKLKKWDKARTYFLSAWRAQRHWKIALNLGLVEHKLGKWRDAAEHLTYGLREAPAGKIEAADRKEAEGLLRDTTRKVGRLVARIQPAGTEVLVDGASVGKVPFADPLFVEPGIHAVEARFEGHVSANRSISAMAGEELVIDVRLDPSPPVIKAVAPVVKAPSQTRTIVLAVGGSTAVAAGLTGLGLLAASFAFKQDAPLGCYRDAVSQVLVNCPNTYVDATNRQALYSNLSMYSLVAAGAIGVTTLIYGLASRSGRATPVRVGAFVASRAAGASMEWLF